MQYFAAAFVVLLVVATTAATGATAQRPSILPDDDDDAHWLSQWTSYQRQYEKHYSSPGEARFRREIFADNLRLVEAHNRAADRGETSYRMAINHLSDRLANEWPTCLRLLANATLLTSTAAKFRTPPGFRVPESLDWRKSGAVTGVKDQDIHDCGSCWAFATTGALEGQHFLKTRKLVSLSEQNLVDCSKANDGCNGGKAVPAFQYVIDNHGIDTEQSYPYEGLDKKCRFKRNEVGATARGYVTLEKNNETKLLEAVASVGPISVTIDASPASFQFYSSGVYYDKQCSSDFTDHEVLVVGYGRDEATGADYWLVKNSWGKTWGEHGYIKMARNRENNCCIACGPSYPLV